MPKELLAQAATLVINTQRGTAWWLMQELDVDFIEASRLIDELTRLGVIGPHKGSGRHDVLYRPGELDTAIGLIQDDDRAYLELIRHSRLPAVDAVHPDAGRPTQIPEND